MAADLSKRLVIGVSSRALFDLSEANQVYETQGVERYAEYQLVRADEVLRPGTGFPLVKAILELNRRSRAKRKAEVVIMSRNSPATSLRIFNSVKHYGLDIERASLSGGDPVSKYLGAYDVSLFLSANEADVQDAANAGFAAGLLYSAPGDLTQPIDQIRIALDGDAVVFSDEAERIYQERGLEAFVEHERQNARKPLPEGPFAKLLRSLSFLQADKSFETPPVRMALVTARSMPAHERVIRTLIEWKVRVDEAHFLGGVSKRKILEAFRPHIFFDDQEVHCRPAAAVVPTARVPYRSDSPLCKPSASGKLGQVSGLALGGCLVLASPAAEETT